MRKQCKLKVTSATGMVMVDRTVSGGNSAHRAIIKAAMQELDAMPEATGVSTIRLQTVGARGWGFYEYRQGGTAAIRLNREEMAARGLDPFGTD